MSEFIQHAQLHGVDIPAIAGFLAASCLSYCPGNWIVRTLHESQLRHLPNPLTLPEKLSQFDMQSAALIGITERFLYIYSVMFNQFSLLSGWLVMKAFFGWMAIQEDTQIARFRYYHTYLFGNILSLLMGLILGRLGIIIRANLALL